MAINLTTKYAKKVSERYRMKSLTAGIASREYDIEANRYLKVPSIGVAPLNNYTRSGANRYGTPADLQDFTQTFEMTQDKGFTYVIDKGDNKQQLNIKSADKSLKREIDEVITPALDKHRFEQWCIGAGTHLAMASAPTKATITANVMDCTEALDEAFTPETGRVMWIKNAYYKVLKQNPDFIGNEKLGEAALVRGQVGRIDDMRVIKVPNSWLPTGVYWLMAHGSALLAPEQLVDYKIHRDPPGYSGDLVEGRIIHDAWVIGERAGGVVAAIDSTYAGTTPTVTGSAANGYTATGDTGAVFYYTTDGSDPRNSDTAVVAANGAISGVTAGQTLKVAAKMANGSKFPSAVATVVVA